MAILFFDGFGVKALADYWTVGGSCPLSASGRRSGTCVSLGSGGSAGSIYRNFSASSTIVLGFAIKGSNQAGTIWFMDDTTVKCSMSVNFTLPAVQMKDEAGNTLGSPITISTINWNYIEVKINVGTNDSDGSYSLRSNEETPDTGTTCNLGHTAINRIKFEDQFVAGILLDDVYLTNGTTFLGDCRVETITPTGAGAVTDWTPSTGSNYACVDEVPESTADYVTETTLNGVDLYAMSDLPSDATGEIFAFQIHLHAKRDSVETKVKPDIYVNSKQYLGSEITLTNAWAPYVNIWETNPDDSAAWEKTDIDAIQCGQKLTSV